MPSVTLDYPVEKANRFRIALGKRKRLVDENGAPRLATLEEVTQWLRQQAATLVREEEAQAARIAAEQAVTDLDD